MQKSLKSYEQNGVHYHRKHGSTLEEEQLAGDDHIDSEVEHLSTNSRYGLNCLFTVNISFVK